MAIVYAINNGNWSDGSTWNTGSVPTAADDVYLNGYTVASFNAYETSVTAKSIHNELFSVTGRIGGTLAQGNGYTVNINADLYGDGVHYIQTISGSRPSLLINGNLNNALIQMSGNGTTITINGNLYGSCFGAFTSGSTRSITINGNVTVTGDALITGTSAGNAYYNLSINGILKQYRNLTNDAYPICNTTLTGEWVIMKDDIVFKDNMTLNGMLDLTNTDKGEVPIAVGKTFMFGNASKSYVRKETVTAIPQSVVLKGYEYGDKVGTLEVVPSTATIVEQATVIESANVVEGDITNVNMTDEQLQRIANCATMDEVAQLSIVIANKDND